MQHNNTVVYTEHFSGVVANHLLNTQNSANPVSQTDYTMLGTLVKAAGPSSFIVTGYDSDNPVHTATNPGSLQYCSRKLRNSLCWGLWVELGFVDGFLNGILMKICGRLGISCTVLEVYDRLCGDQGVREGVQSILKGETEAHNNNNATPQITHQLWNAVRVEVLKVMEAVGKAITKNDISFSTAATTTSKTPIQHAATLLRVEASRCVSALYGYVVGETTAEIEGSCIFLEGSIFLRTSPSVMEVVRGQGFLEKAKAYVAEQTGYVLDVIVCTDLVPRYDLPHQPQPRDPFMVEPGDERSIVERFLAVYPGRLVLCNGRLFWIDEGNTVHTTEQRVKVAVMSAIRDMNVFVKTTSGMTPYTRNNRNVGTVYRALQTHEAIVDEGFLGRLWQKSIGYVGFGQGCGEKKTYSFVDQRVVYTSPPLIASTITRGLPPNQSSGGDVAQFLAKIFNNTEQLEHFLYCLARALAGHVQDRRLVWVAGGGENVRSWIRSMISEAFGGVVDSLHIEHLCRPRYASASVNRRFCFMKELEFARVLLVSDTGGIASCAEIDQSFVQKLVTGGEVVKIQSDFKKPEPVKIQTTAFVFTEAMPDFCIEDQRIACFELHDGDGGEEEGTVDIPERCSTTRDTAITEFTSLVLKNYSTHPQSMTVKGRKRKFQ